jgi:hypothetical protein
VLLNCEEFCDNGGACCEVPDGSIAEKISEIWRSAWSCAVSIWLNGAAGAGFYSALESSSASMLASYFDDVLGIASFTGENSDVSTI